MPTIDLTRIADNIGALNSLQSLLDINNKLSSAQQKLSTGKQINSAEDDPAGLVIATKLNARSQGLKVAMNNISDAKNMMSVAEAGLSQITGILTSMRNKATQAASDTLGGTERATIQTQLSQFAQQINDIVTQTKWNGVQLLSGSLSKQFQTGVETGEYTTWNMATANDPSSLGVSQSVGNAITNINGLGIGAGTTTSTVYNGDNQLSTGQYFLDFKSVAADASHGQLSNINDQTSATGTTTFKIVGNATAGTDELTNMHGHVVTINGVTYGAASSSLSYNIDGSTYSVNLGGGTTGGGTTAGSVSLTAANGTDTGISVWVSGAQTASQLTAASGSIQFDYVKKNMAEVQLQYQDGTAVAVDADGSANTKTLATNFYMTAGSTYDTGRGIQFTAGTINNMKTLEGASAANRTSFNYTAQNAYSVDVSSATKASNYMSTLDNAMDTVNQTMANLGSIMARMDIKSATASSAQINVESAYNTIMNANMAEQQVNASKYQVLQQTAVAMLAQSNQAPQALLSLFK
jgi:flagellin